MSSLSAVKEISPAGLVAGDGCVFSASASIGVLPRGAEPGELQVVFGSQCIIRSSATIYAGSVFGDRVQTGHGALVREDNIVGSDVSLGTNAVLEPGNRIGDRVRIHSGCFLERVTIEDEVFVGPNVTFTDDLHPPCPSYDRCVQGALVRRGASIGGNSTILPGVVIGARSLVAAGSVVVHDVPEGVVVVGNPARVIRRIDELECRSGQQEHPYAWRR